MEYMFFYCGKLPSLNLSSFNTMNVTNMVDMFGSCKNLTTIYVSEGWKNDKVEKSDGMFDQCLKLVGERGTTYSESHIGIDYAHIDEGENNPGYFTYKVPIIPGDVNGDGLVNVTDIVATVNFIMEKPSDNFNKDAADLNDDGVVNVTDIVMMVKIIMEASARGMK